MQEHARTCKNMQEHARTCKNMQEHARTCKNMQEHARTCKNMQELGGLHCRAMYTPCMSYEMVYYIAC